MNSVNSSDTRHILSLVKTILHVDALSVEFALRRPSEMHLVHILLVVEDSTIRVTALEGALVKFACDDFGWGCLDG